MTILKRTNVLLDTLDLIRNDYGYAVRYHGQSRIIWSFPTFEQANAYYHDIVNMSHAQLS